MTRVIAGQGRDGRAAQGQGRPADRQARIGRKDPTRQSGLHRLDDRLLEQPECTKRQRGYVGVAFETPVGRLRHRKRGCDRGQRCAIDAEVDQGLEHDRCLEGFAKCIVGLSLRLQECEGACDRLGQCKAISKCVEHLRRTRRRNDMAGVGRCGEPASVRLLAGNQVAEGACRLGLPTAAGTVQRQQHPCRRQRLALQARQGWKAAVFTLLG